LTGEESPLLPAAGFMYYASIAAILFATAIFDLLLLALLAFLPRRRVAAAISR
jgi:hypothetical protein